jgi:acyl-CoA dehydrogenase
MGMVHAAGIMGLADGPTEVHKVTVARQVLRDYRPTEGMWPSGWIPGRIDAARRQYAEYLELEVGNL